MKPITWDVAMVAIGAIFMAYCLLLAKPKALTGLVSTYIAYLVTLTMGEKVVGLFWGDRVIFKSVWIKSNMPPYVILAGFFLLLVVLLTFFLKLGGKRSRYGFPEIVLYCIGMASVTAVFTLAFLPADLRTHVLSQSKVMPFLNSYREWVTVAPVIFMLVFGITKDEDI